MRSLRGAGIRAGAAALAAALALGGGGCSSSGNHGGPGDGGLPFIILHTNDLHAHLMGFGPEADYSPATTGDDGTVGGLARLAAQIGADRGAAGTTPVLLLDSGDFTMGSPFEILALGAAPELVEMGKLGYDATTVGNHELDWGPGALATMLQAAAGRGAAVPVLATNMTFSATDPGDDQLAGLIQRKVVKQVGGITFGIFGLLGKDASGLSPLKGPLTFEDIAVAARTAVIELRQTDKVDVVVALSHSGIDPMGMGEDRLLAEEPMVKAAGGIDIIISGHTHDSLPMPIKTGNTWIVQAGSYGRFLGKLQMTATRSATATTLALTGYDLERIDDHIAGDAPTQAAVDGYVTAVDAVLSREGYYYKNLIGQVSTDVPVADFAESAIGDLVTDAYLSFTRTVQPAAPPVIAVDAAGDIRDEIKKGKNGRVWFSDLFRVQSLGIGPDGVPGYPLVTFYLNGNDLKSAFEFSALARPQNKRDYFLQVSGATVEWKASAPTFQKVTSLKIGNTAVDLGDATTCYKLVTNLYVASLISLVETVTGNVLSVKPKAEDCKTPVDPATRIVDRNPTTTEVEELKNWQTLILFVYSQTDSDGDTIPNVPASYGAPAVPARIVITP
jgi:5'-nucleotidase / UDP-sugar diphosphatase